MTGQYTTQIAETIFIPFRSIIEPYLEKINIESTKIEDPDYEIPDWKFVDLLELISKEEDDLIGMHMAMRLKARNWGIFGYAVRNSPDLESALRVMAQYVNVFSQGVEEEIIITKNAIGLSYRLTNPFIENRRQDSEFTLTAILSMLREASCSDIKANLVHFEHEAPVITKEFLEYFGVAPKFRQPRNIIMFNRSDMATPVVDPDPRLYELSLQHLEKRLLTRRMPYSLAERISRAVLNTLNNGEGIPSLAQVASSMYISERTLQRRCNYEGIDFLNIIESLRYQIAIDLLKDSDKSLTDITSELGYSQLSSFSRAFKRWSGFNPKQYRDNYKELI
ncbi:AraC-like DNA-binding protein [Halomonas alkaliantarctica]|nr:AraC-like DNA-binding protein [Halomonas alkaliantarctica]